MKLSATICISRDGYGLSLRSLVDLNNTDELCISPNDEQMYVCEKENPDVCIECTPSNPWDRYGRHRLYDEASGDWYLTLDDDDRAVAGLDEHLPEVSDDVGLVFGDVIMRWRGRNGITGREERRRNDADYSDPYNCVYWFGGYYALRAAAWADVRERMDTDYMVHGDTRLFYHLIRAGWTWHRVPKWCEIVTLGERSFDWERYTPGWDRVYEHLENGDGPEAWLIRD